MCRSSLRSSRLLQGGGTSATAPPQSVLDHLMCSPTVLTTSSPAWPGRFLWSALVGAGSRLLLLVLADWRTGCKGERATSACSKSTGLAGTTSHQPGRGHSCHDRELAVVPSYVRPCGNLLVEPRPLDLMRLLHARREPTALQGWMRSKRKQGFLADHFHRRPILGAFKTSRP